MAKWLAAAIIYRRNNGVLEMMVVDQASTHPNYKGRPMQTKFPAGTEENHELEDMTVLDTLWRETPEETDLFFPDNYHPMLIYSESIPGHLKNFYLIPRSDLIGNERQKVKEVDFDLMQPPRYVPVDKIYRELYGTHQRALLKALETLEVRA